MEGLDKPGSQLDLWLDALIEPNKDAQQSLFSLVHLTQSQERLLEVYLEEENTGKRHWELDPKDPNIYIEWLLGCNKIRNAVNKKINARQEANRKQNQQTGGSGRLPTKEEMMKFGNPRKN